MKTDFNGITLAYDQQGSGQAVLFVHGYPLNRKMWQPQLTDLSGYGSIYIVDLRGHGESSDSPGDYSMELFADDLAEFITTSCGNRPVVLCGLSMGGYIAFAFYRKYPHLVAGLVLTSTRAGADSPETKANRDKSIETVKEQGRETIFQGMAQKLLAPANFANEPVLVEMAMSIMRGSGDEAMIAKDLKALRDRPDSTPLLGSIKVPTLIIHGAEDQIIPLAEAQAMQLAIPNARLVILQNAGHMVNLEQPRRFNEAFADFMGQYLKKP
jgi:pimeloyl-ACP methyl ester carboxylesterase